MNQSSPRSTTYLDIVRLLGGLTIMIVALPAIDMPDSYLGGADRWTEFGLWYAAGAATTGLVAMYGFWQRHSWGSYLSTAVLSLNIALFVPAIGADPVRALTVIIWHLVLLGVQLFTLPSGRFPTRSRLGPRDEDAITEWYRTFGPATRHASVASMLLTMAVVGYGLSARPTAMALCYTLNVGAIVASATFLWRLFWEGNRTVLFVLPPLILAAASASQPATALSMLAVYQGVALAFLFARSPLFDELLSYFFDYPALLTVVSFITIILIGTLLLTFPAASPTAEPVAPIDALFTATSAVCVTGLIVLDTPVDFSMFGHSVILVLIQIGGLGIIVLSTFGSVILGERLGLKGEQAVGELLDIKGPKDGYRLATFIVTTTLTIEAIGTLLLAAGYMQHGYGWKNALWHGLFHAISAFCNAGFALQSDSIVMFQENTFVVGVFAALIVLGGLGFVVMLTAWQWVTRSRRPQFHVHAKIVLYTTAVLLVVGTILYGACEWNATLQGLPWWDRIGNAFFQSVTLRTAGFNSVGFGRLESATLVFMMLFMFIGGSPGSTAGGIKTTTVAILVAGVRAISGGKTRVVVFDREIPQRVLYRSAAIAVLALFVLLSSLFLLFVFEDIAFRTLLFEVVSALGTVGLSIGATTQLHAAGKLIITVAMFVGRIGPLTLALLLDQPDDSNVRHPSTDVMVG